MNLLGVPWWRPQPLTPPEMRLLQCVADAHAASALRENVSSQVMRVAAAGSGSFSQALCAGLSTLGDRHAPITQTCYLLAGDRPAVQASALLRAVDKVPGWGNSFFRGEPDPLWQEVDEELQAGFPDWHAKLLAVTATLHWAGKRLFPNPSAYTAATALAVGLPPACASYLFIAARLDSWAAIIHDNLSST